MKEQMTNTSKSSATVQGNQNTYNRSLIEASLDPLVTIGPDGKITDANGAMETVTGRARKELIGTDCCDYFTEPEKARAGYQQVFREGLVRDYPLELRRNDGHVTSVLYNASVYRDEAGKVVGIFAAARDITARKQAEAALLKAGALQSAIFNSANFSSIATDAKGVIQIFNVGAERMLGYVAADVMNKITPAELSDPLEIIARAKALSVELGTPITPGFEALVFKASRGIEDIYELTYIRKDGSRCPAMVSVTALRDAQDAIIGYLLIGTDNTARKRVEERIKLQAREIAELSTPVMQVWQGVVVAPLIGTLDSQRTQRFMERLLDRIVETNSPVALVDIMGVSTIDTQTAQHLIETITAVRLLGAQVVLTGVRPAIAQTLVHLGIDLSGITTRTSLAAGLLVAMDILNLKVVRKNDSN
jgi:PAS domain S-box-containing protein